MKKKGITNKASKIIIPFLFVFLMLSTSLASAAPSQEELEERTALAHLSINANIPPVKVNERVSFEATLIDDFDFNWNLFKDMPYWQTHILWRFMFGLPDIGKILGYTRIKIETRVVDQDDNIVEGWDARTIPSSIPETTKSMEWPIKIEATTYRAGVEYAVFIRLKLTRYNAWDELDGISYLYIPMKAAAYNDIEMKSRVSSKRVTPKSIATFDIEFKNNGYYPDVFNFMVEGENGIKGHFDTQAMYMQPDETRSAKLYLMTPGDTYDPGTPHRIKIYTYSRLNQTKTYIGTVNLITEGSHVSPLYMIITIFTISIFAAIVLFYKFVYLKKRTKKDKKQVKKKENKEGFLSNLFSEKKKEKSKKTKKEEPKEKKEKKTSKEKTEEKKEKGFFSSLFEKKEPKKEDKKEKTKNEEKTVKPKKEEKPETKEKKDEIKKPVKKEKKQSKEQLKKQRELEKIRKKQEKQKRKFL